MDVLAIILACSLYPDDQLLEVMVAVQSNANPNFVGDLANLKTIDTLTSADAALKAAEEIRQHGGRAAVGLLGVPIEWASRYGREPRELFDACINISIASAAFAEYRDRCDSTVPPPRPRHAKSQHRPPRRRPSLEAIRSCVLRQFAADIGVASAPDVILERLAAAASSHSDSTTDPPPQRSSIFLDDATARLTPAAAPHLDPVPPPAPPAPHHESARPR